MKKQQSIVMMLVMMVFIGFGIIIPVLPAIVEEQGNGHLHLGLMLALYSAASFVMAPFWGSLSDRIGRRPVILLGLVGFTAGFLIFALADDRLWMMYASRIIGGLFSGAVASCAVAYIADITDEDNRTKGMGLIGMSIGLGFLIGPPIGGVLSLVGHYVPFFASAGVTFLLFLFALRGLPESLPIDQRRTQQEQKESRLTAFKGSLKYLYLLSFFVSFTLAGLESTFQFFQMERLGVTPFQVSLMFFLSGIVGAGIQGGVVRKRVKKGDEPKAIAIGLVLSAIGFALILFSSNWLTAAIFMSVFAAGNSLIRPCVLSLITQKSVVRHGVSTGLNTSMDSLGRIAGPILFSSILYGIRIELPFLVGAFVSVAALWLLIRFVSHDRSVQPPHSADL